ncbi:class I SAM-dependent methyltransferase [soil metagenome]
MIDRPTLFQRTVGDPLRLVMRNAVRPIGLGHRFRSLDRRVLEDCILAHYAASVRPLSLLFVGTHWYTRRYEALLAPHRFVSVDIDPRAERFGSRHRHIVGCASRLADHLAPGSIDIVIFNGVFGWGLHDRVVIEQAVGGFHDLLAEGGDLVFGWNDVAARRPMPVTELQALKRFVPSTFAPLGRHCVEIPGRNRHRFAFYRKLTGPDGTTPATTARR